VGQDCSLCQHAHTGSGAHPAAATAITKTATMLITLAIILKVISTVANTNDRSSYVTLYRYKR
jgi:hypothetical protein